MSVLHDLEQILALFRSQGRKTEVFQNKKVLFGQILEEPEQFSRTSGNIERLEEAGKTQEEDPISQTAGLVSERFGQIAFSDAGGTGEKDILVIGDPLAGKKGLDQRTGKVSCGSDEQSSSGSTLRPGLRDGGFLPPTRRAGSVRPSVLPRSRSGSPGSSGRKRNPGPEEARKGVPALLRSMEVATRSPGRSRLMVPRLPVPGQSRIARTVGDCHRLRRSLIAVTMCSDVRAMGISFSIWG